MEKVRDQITCSVMSGKMKGIPSINTNPLTNSFCNGQQEVKNSICRSCYSRKMLTTFRKFCAPPWEKNGRILSTRILAKEELPIINSRYIRIHSHGELINMTHLHNIIAIAKVNRHSRFVTWSKRKNLVGRVDLPRNLKFIYSTPKVNETKIILPKNFSKVFSVYTDSSLAEINCHGKTCLSCLLCYKGKTVRINEIVK